MIKKIITCLLVVALVFILFGCVAKKAEEPTRFIKEYSQKCNGDCVYILRDIETGRAYLLYRCGYGGGVTQLYEVAE